MKKDNNDPSVNLNTDFNEQDPKIKDIPEEKDKIYSPPDINEVKEKKEKPFLETLKETKDQMIKDIDFILEDFLSLGEDNEKYKNLFNKLKEQRKNPDIISEEEYQLLDIMLIQFEHPGQFTFDKIFMKDKKDEVNNLNIGLGENLEEDKKENNPMTLKCEMHHITVKQISIDELKDIYLKQKKQQEQEENLIIKNNDKIAEFNNRNNNNEPQFEKIKCLLCKRCLSSCCDYLCGCCCLDKCFEKADTERYEDLNLQISFLIYFVQYLLYLIILLNGNSKRLPSLYIQFMIIIALFSTYIFYKLNFKKYDERFLANTCLISFYFIVISIFKGLIYFLMNLIIKEGFNNENAFGILIAFFCFKMAFLLINSFYFMVRDGLVNYCIIFSNGIIPALIVSLITFFCLSLLEFEILIIMCVVQIILFILGIFLSSSTESLQDLKLWNTLIVDIYKLSVFLFPMFGICAFCLIIWTFGAIIYCCRNS